MTTSRDRSDIADLQRGILAYLEGKTGIRYEPLVRFAEPLFQLYDLDIRSAGRSGADRRSDEMATLLAILDTARLFWAYFLLDEIESVERIENLRRVFLGPRPSREDDSSLVELLQVLEDQWNEIGQTRIRSAGVEGYALPSFDELLAEYDARHGLEFSSNGQVPPQLSESPETLAAFAQPLLESIDAEDPELLDDAMARAQAYWELAQMTGEAYEQRLTSLARRFSDSNRSVAKVRIEAERMSTRFRSLFSE